MSESASTVPAGRPGGDFWGSSSPGGSGRSFDPLAYFRSVLQYKWPILGATAVAAALAVVYTMTATPLYRSTQVLLLESTDTNVVAVEKLIETGSEDIGYVQTQIEILQSRDLAGRVMDSLALLEDPVFVADLADYAGVEPEQLGSTPPEADASSGPAAGVLPEERIRAVAIGFLQSRLSVSEVPTTRLLHIDFLSPDPDLSVRVANETGLQYILSYVESNRSLVEGVSGWLDGRLDELKGKLDASERRLLEFKNANGLIGVDGDLGRLGEQELLQSTTELAEARLRLQGVADQLRELRGETTTQGRLARLPSLQSDLLIQQTRVDLRRASQEMQRLSTQYGPRHPSRVELQSELDSLQASLDAAVAQAVDSVENEYRLLAGQVASLEARLDTGRETIRDIDDKSVEFAVLEREVQTNRDLYYRFFERMVETRSTQGLESTNATVIEYAKPAFEPAKPDKAFIVLLATLGALLLSTLLAMIVSALDDSIRRLSDVEERLATQLLGVVPVYRRTRGRFGRLLGLGNREADARSKRMFAESFKSVRTNLLIGEHDNRTLLITSSVPGEGKSMSSICLARTFAPTERVLLIDADIRRPSIARALKLDHEAPGLTHVLAGRGGAAHYIQAYAAGGFDVLTSGLGTDHPLELLLSGRFESMLEGLSSSYDRVIIDCAPVEAVSDALLLSRLVDAVIYVAKSHDTSVRVVSSGLEKLRVADAPLAGVLLTQVDLGKLAAYGADYEFHGYYDYYDYAETAKGSELALDREELRHLRSHGSGRASEDRAVGRSRSGTAA